MLSVMSAVYGRMWRWVIIGGHQSICCIVYTMAKDEVGDNRGYGKCMVDNVS